MAVATAEREIAARTAAAAIAPALTAAKTLSTSGLALVHGEFGNRPWRRRVIVRTGEGGAYQGSMPHPAAWQLVSNRFVALGG